MTDVRYERNSAGLAQVLLADDMARMVNEAAFGGLVAFESIAVRRSGDYADSAEVIDDTQAAPTPRRVAHLVATVDYAAKLEFGDQPGEGSRRAHHTLAQTADLIEGGTR